MQQRLFFLIILFKCASITSQISTISFGKINVNFHYSSKESGVIEIPVLTQPILKKNVNNSYVFKAQAINDKTFIVRAVSCMYFQRISEYCGQDFESSYMFLQNSCMFLQNIMSTDQYVLKIEDKTPNLKRLLRRLYSPRSSNELDFNVTYVLIDCHNDNLNKPKDPYDHPLSKTSLFGIIFLSSCIVLLCILCIGWFGLIYYRRFTQYRMKKNLQKALIQSTQQMLNKSPVIIFDPNNKDNEHIDDDPMCAICLESFKTKEKIRKLVCSHYFHITCIDPWLLSRQSCPLCNRNILRNSIPSISSSIMAAINERNEESTTIGNNNQTNQTQNLNV